MGRRDAIRQLITWDTTVGQLSMSVNVSARNLSDPLFVRRIQHLVDDSGLAPHRFVLEITETAVFADVDRAAAALSQLAARGMRISLDDFGQGQTSFTYLSRLPVHELKIDKAFVSDMLLDDTHAAIVRSLIDLAHTLGFSVTHQSEYRGSPVTSCALPDTTCSRSRQHASLLWRPGPGAPDPRERPRVPRHRSLP